MGLIAATWNAAGGTLASQWKEYFYVDSLPDNVLATKAEKKVKARFGGSRREDDNVISDGSVVAVADGQCMMIVDQGKIVDFCAEPGEYVFEQGGEPSIFYGAVQWREDESRFENHLRPPFLWRSGAARDQRVYFFNTKEILGNKYGTPSPVPFRVVDKQHRSGRGYFHPLLRRIQLSRDQPDAVLHQCLRQCGGRLTRASQIDSQLKERAADRASARVRKDFREGRPLQRAAGAHARRSPPRSTTCFPKSGRICAASAIVSFGVNSVKASEGGRGR